MKSGPSGIRQLIDQKNQIVSQLMDYKRSGEKVFRGVILGATCYTLFLLGLIAFSVLSGSSQVFLQEGLSFITGTNWNPVEGRESYGALPYIVGTLVSSGIAMAIGVPISIGIAMFISEISTHKLATPLSFVIELLAAVPSIVYGLWALFVFRFWISDYIETPLYNAFGGSVPFFADTPFGLDVFTAGIVLAIMIIPTISSVSREVMKAVPNSQREAAYSLGATRWETVRVAIFPYAKSGLIGAAILGLGRAVGETMLVAMIIGNAIGKAAIPTSLFAPSQTLSSLIANEFNESVTNLHTAALIGLGLVLLILTLGINLGARLLVSRLSRTPSAKQSAKKQIKISSIKKSFDTERTQRLKVTGLMIKQSLNRRIADRVATGLAILAVMLAIIPLGSILVEVIGNGAPVLSLAFLTQPPGAVGTSDGGVGPSIQGTLIVIGLASAIGAPIGVMAGIYLSEFSGNGRFAYIVRLINDILTGLPSIVIGIVGYVTVVLAIGSFSVWAGAFALSILMIPIIVRVTEETLRIVPDSIREAGYSLGIPKWKVVTFIVFKSAASGVLTGIVLGISRITGETAPLIMTILGTSLFFSGFVGPMDALPLRIWRLSSQPYESAHAFGWGAALILIIIVLSLSVGIRYFSSLRGLKRSTVVV